MAYLFGSGVNHNIDCGTSVAGGSIFSTLVKYKPTAVDASSRVLAARHNGATQANFVWIISAVGGTNNSVSLLMTTGGGGALPTVTWQATLSVAIHTLVGTYDGANMRIYADGDATAKATLAETGTPDQAGQRFAIGIDIPGGSTLSAAGTIYEALWAPGTAWTAAQAAAMSAGNAVGISAPQNYWPLITNAGEFFGVAAGTVTGASVVAHSGVNLYTVVASRSIGGGALVNGGLVG